MLSFIVWDAAPEIFSLGPLVVRWYGLLFALGFLVGQQIMLWIYKQEGLSEKHIETLTIYMVVSTVVGARLGHCLFYDFDYYFLQYPYKILYIWQGGLASHGAAIGILFALYMYSRKYPEQTYLFVLDRMVIVIALSAFLIRLGNFTNSEIIGKPADSPLSMVFARSAEDMLMTRQTQNGPIPERYMKSVEVESKERDTLIDGQKLAVLNFHVEFDDKSIPPSMYNGLVQGVIKDKLSGYEEDTDEQKFDHIIVPQDSIKAVYSSGKYPQADFEAYGIPRHPSQLYESISSLILFIILMAIYYRYRRETPRGLIFGFFVIWIFGLRFVYEFLKENQSAFEDKLPLNMGQFLSIPLVLAGIWVLIRSISKKKTA